MFSLSPNLSPGHHLFSASASLYSFIYHAPGACASLPGTCEKIKNKLEKVQELIKDNLDKLSKKELELSAKNTESSIEKRYICKLAAQKLRELSKELTEKEKKLLPQNWHLRVQHSYGKDLKENSKELIEYAEEYASFLLESGLQGEISLDKYLGKLISEHREIREIPTVQLADKDEFLWEAGADPLINPTDVRTLTTSSLVFTAYTYLREAGIGSSVLIFISAAKSFFKTPRANVLEQYKSVLENIKKCASETELRIREIKNSVTRNEVKGMNPRIQATENKIKNIEPRIQVAESKIGSTEEDVKKLKAAIYAAQKKQEISDRENRQLENALEGLGERYILLAEKVKIMSERLRLEFKDFVIDEVDSLDTEFTTIENNPIEHSPRLTNFYLKILNSNSILFSEKRAEVINKNRKNPYFPSYMQNKIHSFSISARA